MRLSDWLGEAGVWFHINSDHHVMALVDVGYAHFHHLAFETVDIGKMRDLLDHVARHGRWLSWGPTRHGIAGNIASYVRIPEEECHVELYCDMEQLQDDHIPRTYSRTTAIPRTPGARCRRGRTFASTRSLSSSRARAGRPAASCCRPCRTGGRDQGDPSARLHRPQDAGRALLARAVSAVALRRHVPRHRLLGRSGSAPSRFSPRGSSRTPIRAAARSSPPTGSRARSSATSSSIRRAHSTRRSSSSSAASSRARR